jgi:mono/diheme cytochrome c family protein
LKSWDPERSPDDDGDRSDRHEGDAMGDSTARSRLQLGLCVALAAAALALLAGCGGSGRSASPAARSSASASAPGVKVEQVGADRWAYARARFREMCAGCHTLRSAGTRGRRIDLDRDGGQNPAIRHVILGGEPGMPAWRGVISRRELEELIAFISVTARRDLGGENNWHYQIMLRAEGEYHTPARNPPGDRWGYAIARFHEMCASCHTLAAAGAQGRRFDLDHAGHLDARTVRHAVLEGLPGMPSFNGVIARGELAEIAAFVAANAKGETGETNIQWEQRLRAEGERWKPEG